MKILKLSGYFFSLVIALCLCTNTAVAADEFGVCELPIKSVSNMVRKPITKDGSISFVRQMDIDDFFNQTRGRFFGCDSDQGGVCHFAWYLSELPHHSSILTSFNSYDVTGSRILDNNNNYRLVTINGILTAFSSNKKTPIVFNLARSARTGKWDLTMTGDGNTLELKDAITCYTYLNNSHNPSFLPIAVVYTNAYYNYDTSSASMLVPPIVTTQSSAQAVGPGTSPQQPVGPGTSTQQPFGPVISPQPVGPVTSPQPVGPENALSPTIGSVSQTMPPRVGPKTAEEKRSVGTSSYNGCAAIKNFKIILT